MQTNVLKTAPTLTYSRDYAEMLRMIDVDYKEVDEHFLQVGEVTKIQGWIIHLSVIRTQAQQLVEKVIPLLISDKTPFKVVKNYNIARRSLTGDLGYHLLGKIITLYYEDEQSLVSYTRNLLEATKEFKGPAIPTDAHIGGIVYARYGGFSPLLQTDITGATEKYIHDRHGKLVEDTYSIPFSMPDKAEWPFKEIIAPPSNKNKKILNNNYLITTIIKSDVKGEVFRALRATRYFPEWCVIKEGKHDMWSDDYGRDIQDRLRWQYKIQKYLYDFVPVPKPYGLFQEKEATYLAMEYIKGWDLDDVIQDIYAHQGWRELQQDKKEKLLDYLFQIVDLCETLHQKGFIHRDLALTNFIVNKKDRLVMIDLELAYFRNDKQPRPPFRLGTPGFMSPEQIRTEHPTEKEDIYALAAVMIQVLTGIHPIKFGIYFTHELIENLVVLNGSERIARIIVQCLHTDPCERPSLADIKVNLIKYREELSDTKTGINPISNEAEIGCASEILRETVNSLCCLLLEDPLRLNFKEIEDTINPASDLVLGWYNGLSGTLYLLAKTAPYLSIPNLKTAFSRGCEYLIQHRKEIYNDLTGSLYSGSSGIALTVAEGLNSGLLQNGTKETLELWQLLKANNTRLDFAHGLAGQGTVILRCMPYLDKNLASQWLQHHVDILLSTQQKDGSWIVSNNRKERNASFSFGHSGIVFFLLFYLEFNPAETRVRESLYKALEWMCSRPAKTAGSYLWQVKNGYEKINIGLDGELAGIALSCLAAYQKLKEPRYKICAEEILRQIPSNLIDQDFSLASGLAGLGHVYLEAWHQLGNDEWRKRADAVATILLRCSYRENASMRYWVAANNRPNYGNLMPGSSGVAYFLTHYIALNTEWPFIKKTHSTLFSIQTPT